MRAHAPGWPALCGTPGHARRGGRFRPCPAGHRVASHRQIAARRDVASRQHSVSGGSAHALSPALLWSPCHRCRDLDAALDATTASSAAQLRAGVLCSATAANQGPHGDDEAGHAPDAARDTTPAVERASPAVVGAAARTEGNGSAASSSGRGETAAGGAAAARESAPSPQRPRTAREQLQRNVLAACKGLWRSQTSSWQQLRKEKRLLQVPWGGDTIVQVMFFWVLAFCFLGSFVLPVALDLLDLDRASLSPRLQALSHLALDALQMGATLAILWVCLRPHRDRPAEDGWFRVALRPPARWLVPTCLACLLFPAINALSQLSQSLFPASGSPWSAGSLEQSLGSGDWATNLVYFVIVGVCAPVWEEAIFRGFLLPSLGRWLPVPAAIAASAAIFALAHLQAGQLAPLLALGALLGLLFVHTRNLLAPVVLHSSWNLYIFYEITRAAAAASALAL